MAHYLVVKLNAEDGDAFREHVANGWLEDASVTVGFPQGPLTGEIISHSHAEMDRLLGMEQRARNVLAQGDGSGGSVVDLLRAGWHDAARHILDEQA